MIILENLSRMLHDSQKWHDSLDHKWMRPRNVGVARATLTREDNEWSWKFEEPLQSRPRQRACQDPLTRQGGDALRLCTEDVKFPMNFLREEYLVRGSRLSTKSRFSWSDQSLLPTHLTLKKPLPLHSWKPLIYKSHIECTPPWRSQILHICSLPLSK